MLTLHRPLRGVRLTSGEDAPTEAGYAVVVGGGRIAALGPYEELLRSYVTGVPAARAARVREWDGVLTPGRCEPDAAALLEGAYWPDPREAEELGTEPLRGDALAALSMGDTRWGASARRGVQRLLARGTTALTGTLTRPAVRAAVVRSGVRYTERGAPRRALVPSGAADFAVFAEDGTCVATVLGGRLVHRRA
ncbi:hypothetical protein I3F58_20240 [Streptomyces sp. MUM 203J]|uniref:imidazolonepropionase-like domain-containing protein n=1 Tax=Streptomyces sp. MUM 203J TaxID=2791990 RepID=UPI001F0478C8|nr:hypothetical protein [Streptomyces sp. MUM 203J]MCH0541854.1 hypothetical protein [Streptomyces sp. MUM 203J]